MALDAGNKIINTNTGLVVEGKDVSSGYFSIDNLANIPDYSKVTGAQCYETSTGKTFRYNGSTWEEIDFGKLDDVQVNGTSIVSNKVANLTGSNLPSHSLGKISDVTATAAEVNVLDGITATTTELNYVDGVTSNIQTQLNNKQQTINDSNKLSADLVQDGTTNKVVTQTEKNTWNGKSVVIWRTY